MNRFDKTTKAVSDNTWYQVKVNNQYVLYDWCPWAFVLIVLVALVLLARLVLKKRR